MPLLVPRRLFDSPSLRLLPILSLAAVLSGQNWMRVRTTSSPPGRIQPLLAYDANRKVTVLYGGWTTIGTLFRDTWEYNGVTWKQIRTQSAPSGWKGDLVYDPIGKRVLFVQASDSLKFRARDIWTFDGRDWKRLHQGRSNAPQEFAVVFDEGARQLLLFGDYGTVGDKTCTYAFTSKTWKCGGAATYPMPRVAAALAFDPIDQSALLFGGLHHAGSRVTTLSDTWTYQDGRWQRQNPRLSPKPNIGDTMVHDSGRGGMILFANGRWPLNETWEWVDGQWRQLTTTTMPPSRLQCGLAYDSARRRVVLFGGAATPGPGLHSDTWELPSTTRTRARFGTYAQGCTTGSMRLDAAGSSRPLTNARMAFSITRVPAGQRTGIVTGGLSNHVFGTTPLPIPLDSIGFKGCRLHHSFEFYWLFTVSNGTGNTSVAVPNVAGILGLRVFLQAAAGAKVSNVGVMQVGNL